MCQIFICCTTIIFIPYGNFLEDENNVPAEIYSNGNYNKHDFLLSNYIEITVVSLNLMQHEVLNQRWMVTLIIEISKRKRKETL